MSRFLNLPGAYRDQSGQREPKLVSSAETLGFSRTRASHPLPMFPGILSDLGRKGVATPGKRGSN